MAVYNRVLQNITELQNVSSASTWTNFWACLFSDGVDVNIDVDFDLGLQGLVVPQTNVAEVLRLRNFEKTYGFIMLMFLYCLYFQIIYICYLV